MRKVNKSCFSRHSISTSEELCMFLLKWKKNHSPLHSWYRKHSAARHQHSEAPLGLCPVAAGRPDRRPQLVLQGQPGHLQGAALRASVTQPAAEEGERTILHSA